MNNDNEKIRLMLSFFNRGLKKQILKSTSTFDVCEIEGKYSGRFWRES